MTEWEYQEARQALRDHAASFKGKPQAAREYLQELGVGHLLAPRDRNAEIVYPCASEFIMVDLSVFLCD
jgi:hypothetical protein